MHYSCYNILKFFFSHLAPYDLQFNNTIIIVVVLLFFSITTRYIFYFIFPIYRTIFKLSEYTTLTR